MRQKLSLLLLMALFAVGGVNATELELDLSKLSSGIYNSSTNVLNFGTGWDGSNWAVYTWNSDQQKNVGADYSAYSEFVLEYETTSSIQFRVYFKGETETIQAAYPTSNSTFGRTVIKLNGDFSNIHEIWITAAGKDAFTMTLTKAFFRSKSNESSTSLWTGTTALGSWGNMTELTSDGDGKTALKGAKVDDVIRVTFTNAQSGNQIYVCNSSYTGFIDADFSGFSVQDDAQTADYVIPNAEVLESIQLNGLIVSGKYATITKIELITYDESYDACMVTIGSDGIATFSTGSKKLDFSDTGITPYYASAVESGTVTLTSVTDKTTWGYQGYILKGTAGTYEVPTTSGGTYQNKDYLKATGDYSASVAASADGAFHYIFAKNGSGTVSFYKLANNAHTLAAHKAYLETETDITPSTSNAGARAITLNFDDGTTAILPIFQDGNSSIAGSENNACYTLQGIRVQNPTKGLYIQNGKKFMVK